MNITRQRRLPIAAALAAAWVAGAALAADTAPPPSADVFARVGDRVISVRDYESALAAGVRQKFYHGRPAAEDLARFGREVGEGLVAQALLSAEAERRGIEPDRAAIDRQLAEYERRYADSTQWKQSRESVLPRLVAELERRSRLERLEASVRAVPSPGEAAIRAYYESKPERFTEPEQLRLSLILLKLEPAASAADREAAMALAGDLHRQLAAGADFAALARKHSGDPSAASGGDLGYVHRGMLPQAVEKQFADGLEPGQVSAPSRVLEGVAIVRLEDRKAPRLRPFDEVAGNAAALLQRDLGEQAWTRLKSDLRASAAVWVDETRFAAAGSK